MTLPPYDPPRPVPSPAPSPAIFIDEHGVMRVAGTRLAIDSMLAAFLEGRSPESIQRSFRSASLEQVYGVIAYYLGNRPAVDAYLQSQEAVWEYARAYSEVQPSPVVDRLKQAMREQHPAGRHQ